MSNILKSEPLFNCFPCYFRKLSLSLHLILTAKLQLPVQISVDGYVAGPKGELDWMTWNLDDEIKQFIISLADSSDTILLGRKMTDRFVRYWENVVSNQPSSPEFSLARQLVDTPKVVFSKALDESR